MKINSNQRTAAAGKKAAAVGLALLLAAPMAGASDDDNFDCKDFGLMVEQALRAQSEKYFGFNRPIKESAPATTGQYRTASQKAADQVLIADGLKVEYLTRNAANMTDMMTFFRPISRRIWSLASKAALKP